MSAGVLPVVVPVAAPMVIARPSGRVIGIGVCIRNVQRSITCGTTERGPIILSDAVDAERVVIGRTGRRSTSGIARELTAAHQLKVCGLDRVTRVGAHGRKTIASRERSREAVPTSHQICSRVWSALPAYRPERSSVGVIVVVAVIGVIGDLNRVRNPRARDRHRKRSSPCSRAVGGTQRHVGSSCGRRRARD